MVFVPIFALLALTKAHRKAISMAKGKKTGGRDFQLGHHIGRPRLPEEIKKARKLTTATFTELANELLYLSRAGLKDRLESKETPVLELLLGKTIESAISSGNLQKIQIILEKLIDKKPLEDSDKDTVKYCGYRIPSGLRLQIAMVTGEITHEEMIKIARREQED